MSKEEDYEMVLLIRVKGHGDEQHKQKTASRIKRILETNLHKEIKVSTNTRRTHSVIPEGIWQEVERDDSNAYVSEER